MSFETLADDVTHHVDSLTTLHADASETPEERALIDRARTTGLSYAAALRALAAHYAAAAETE